MKKIIGLLLSLLLSLALFSQTVGAYTLQTGESAIQYRNYEALFRSDGQGNYVEWDWATQTNIAVGDIFVGIILVNEIQSDGSTVWTPTVGSEEISGIFAQEVTGFDFAYKTGSLTVELGFTSQSTFTTLGGETFNTGLAANEMMRIYLDDGSNSPFSAFTTNTTLEGDVANATNGKLWMSLGHEAGEDAGEYAYSVTTPHGTEFQDFDGNSYIGLSVLDYIGNVDLIGTPLLNDPQEGKYNQDVEFFANSQLGPHYNYLNGKSEWAYESEDPGRVGVVPEPGTFLLFGAGLLSLSAVARRRKA